MTKATSLLDKPEALAFTEVELTSQQDGLWDQTRAKFLWEAPGFTHLLYKMMNPKRQGAKAVFTKDVPVAGTDGIYVVFNPDTFFKYTLPERVFITGHEVVHAMLNHPVTFHAYRTRGKVTFADGTSLPFIEDVIQMGADFIINDMLVNAKIGKCPAGVCHDPQLITYQDSLPEAYRKLYKAMRLPPKLPKVGVVTPGGNGGMAGPRGQKGFDVVMKPGTAEGKNPHTASNERSEQAWKTATAAAMAAAKAQGKLPASMNHMFGELLTPTVAWDQYIVGFFKRRLGSGSWNFRRPDRRLISRDPTIYAPQRSGFGANNVVVGIDTSGSIGPKTIDLFLGECAGILEDVRPERIWLMWCDAKVHRVDECEDYGDLMRIRADGAPGRGGTSFVPVFDKVKDLGFRPDALLYLTDGMGTFPQAEPDYPVLWGNIFPQSKYPWGEVVEVPAVE